jgi:hypothetical protein
MNLPERYGFEPLVGYAQHRKDRSFRMLGD